MSSDAVGWTFRHSPAKGAVLTVHLAIADSVNDQHGNQLWMSVRNLARKARVERKTAGRAIDWLVSHGLLADLEDESLFDADKLGRPRHYRFLFPTIDVIFESRGAGTGDAPGARSRRAQAGNQDAPGGSSGRTPHIGMSRDDAITTQGKPNEQPNNVVDAADDNIEALCLQLADAIEAHAKVGRPAVTARWHKDMRLLVDRGPTDVDQGEVGIERVQRAIEFVFTHLNEPEGNTTFCWADVVRSPGSLRKHWSKILAAGRVQQRGRSSKAMRGLDRAAKRVAERHGDKSLTDSGSMADDARSLFSGALASSTPKELTDGRK